MSTSTAGPLGPSAAQARRRNGMGTAALVVGVVALVLAVLIIFFPLAALLGIFGAIFGIIGMRRVSRGEADNRPHAVAGLVTGLLAVAIAVSIGVRLGTFINDHQGDFRRFWSCITSAPTDAEQDDCGRELAESLD
jgi:glycerol uptake facilitator-like aquaporin